MLLRQLGMCHKVFEYNNLHPNFQYQMNDLNDLPLARTEWQAYDAVNDLNVFR